MKIGIVLSSPPGYSETFFNSKIKGLQNAGHLVTLYVKKANAVFSLCKVVVAPKVNSNPIVFAFNALLQFALLLPYIARVRRFYKLERSDGTSIKNVLKKIYLNAHLLRANADWLHFGFATVALGSENVAQSISAKMGVSFRGFDINIYPLKHPDCYKKLWSKVDKVHSISEYLYHKAITLGLSQTVPFQIITPATSIKPLESKESNDVPLTFVTVARLNWIKGLDIAIEAMRLLKITGIDFRYKIIGGGTQKEMERYAFQAYEAGLKDEVQFLGVLSHGETIEEMNTASLYIQPSLNEGFCNAVLEAQALGKLVIASDVGGLPENIEDGVSGFLFETGNAADLTLKIQHVLSLSIEAKLKITDAAIQRVKKTFTITQQQKAFIKFYKEDLNS